MANVKISDLTEDTSPATGDWVETEDVSANASKKVSLANILPADSVTDAKLVNGKVKQRQGGNASNWNAAGTSNYATDTGAVKIQCGAITVSANPTIVTYPEAFTNNPLVIACVASASSYNTFCVQTAGASTTQASFRVVDDAGTARTGETVNWIAIGI